jgi:IMP dehydrogenase
MSVIFSWSDIPKKDKGITFDDVLLIPNKSDIRSRSIPDLSSRFTKNITLERPFISANMDTITESGMMIAMHKMGAVGILHRFLNIQDQIKEIETAKAAGVKVLAASIGVNDDFKDRAAGLVAAGVSVLTIDIAHGHSISMMDTLKWVKDTYPQIEIVAGNVATPEATRDLIEAGASAVKVGIGPGSMCTTRVITGCGVPQLTAIALCYEAAREYDVPVIADGGLKASGDIVKAFAAGASSVMLGSLLSGTIETPGEIRNGQKQYRGMASKSAQVSWRGGVPEGMAPEGESRFVAIKGHVSDVIHELSGGVRSGMTYVNAMTIKEIQNNARFIEVTSQGRFESVAHGLQY